MALVHSLGRVHRDLKSGNVLATAHRGGVTLKVADFGTVTLAGSRQRPEPPLAASPGFMTEEAGGVAMTQGIGTPLWMAPEILAGQSYGISADVYSFAIVLWEIAAQAQPWDEIVGDFLCDALLKAIEEGRRPLVQAHWPANYVAVMRSCWAREPQQRPTFKSVLEELALSL
jgi:LRR receptor-like serine/threonine-protein kinase FLS2